MNFINFAIKHRKTTMKFSQIPSHESVKRQLRDMVADGRVPHAILLHGPSGIGKFMLARTFSQYLHCQNPTADGEPCGVCPSCMQHEGFNHVDSIYVYPVVKTDKLKAPVSADYITCGHHDSVALQDRDNMAAREDERADRQQASETD